MAIMKEDFPYSWLERALGLDRPREFHAEPSWYPRVIVALSVLCFSWAIVLIVLNAPMVA